MSPPYGFLSVHSPLRAHLHRLGSEWLWGDVHDVHLINSKYCFVRERFQLREWWIRGIFVGFQVLFFCSPICLDVPCITGPRVLGLTAKPFSLAPKQAGVTPRVPCSCLWPCLWREGAGPCPRRQEQGKQGPLSMLSLISHGCCPEALQELWLTVPFVDKPVLEPPSPNLCRCLELSGSIVALFLARAQMSGQIGGTLSWNVECALGRTTRMPQNGFFLSWEEGWRWG